MPLAAPPVELGSWRLDDGRTDSGASGDLTLHVGAGGDAPPSTEDLLEKLANEARLAAAKDPQRALALTRRRSDNLNVPPAAWLASPEPSLPPSGQPLYDGRGAVVVVDCARYLPDDVVASAVRASLLDERGTVLQQVRGHCLVLSDSRMPKFQVKLLLGGTPPANATLAIALTAVVAGVEEAVTLGYGALALFVRHNDPSFTQPTSPSERRVALNAGNFQLPLHIGSELALPRRGVLVSEASLRDEPRLPAATVLVRVVRGPEAAAHASGAPHAQRAVLAAHPVPPAPSYMSGLYDSSRSAPRKNEVLLYKHRLQRPPVQCIEAVQDEADARDQQVRDVDEADEWLDRHLDSPEAEEVYSLRGFAPYDPATGVQVGARSASALPHAAVSYAVLSLYPPGAAYANPPQLGGGRVRHTTSHDWSSELRSPVWTDRAFHLPAVPPDPTTLLVVDVRCLERPTNPQSLKPQGWAVVPLFEEGAVDSGVHQLPLFAGTPSSRALEALSKAAPKSAAEWQRALSVIAPEHHIGLVEAASVTVTILDAQRFGEYDRPEALPPLVTPDRARIPHGFVDNYTKGLPHSKQMASLVGKVKAPPKPEAAEPPPPAGPGTAGGGAATPSGDPPRPAPLVRSGRSRANLSMGSLFGGGGGGGGKAEEGQGGGGDAHAGGAHRGVARDLPRGVRLRLDGRCGGRAGSPHQDQPHGADSPGAPQSHNSIRSR